LIYVNSEGQPRSFVNNRLLRHVICHFLQISDGLTRRNQALRLMCCSAHEQSGW